jgi:hypothetical protein
LSAATWKAYDRDVARAYTFDAVLPVLGLSGSMRPVRLLPWKTQRARCLPHGHTRIRHTAAGFDLVVLCERKHHYRLSVKPTADSVCGPEQRLERADG